MLLVVLCAIVGTQHFTLHTCVLAAARAPTVRAATAMCARESGHRVAWRAGQRACAGRGEKSSTSHGKGGETFLDCLMNECR